MIGLVVTEWFYQAGRKRNRAKDQAESDQRVATATRDHFLAIAAEKRRQIEVEDAKYGTKKYDPQLIIWLLAEEEEAFDQACASQWESLDAWSRTAYL